MADPLKMVDIARLAQVHVSTVSRALAGHASVSESARKKILQIAASRGYQVNVAARSLRTRKAENISVAIPLGHEAAQPLSDPFLVAMIGHLADEITRRGFGLLLQKIVPPMDDWLADLIASRPPVGIIVIGQSTEHARLEAIAGEFTPLVVWGGPSLGQSYCTVGSDNVAGARLITEHLLSLGRRHVVFLGDIKVPEFRLRYKGYSLALAGSPGDRCNIPTHMTANEAFAAMSRYLASGKEIDGVVCATDMIAISAIRAIAASGRRVPQDISVVGYDDLSIAAHTNPRLTTVRQDIALGAQYLMDLLFRRMEGEATPSMTMAPELIIRESCGAGR